MKVKLFLLVLAICSYFICSAQDAAKILEKGIKVQKNKKIFFELGEKEIKIYIGKSVGDKANPPSFLKQIDSTIYLLQDNGMNAYIKPVNPLNYSYSGSNTFTVDETTQAFTNAITTLTDQLKAIGTRTRNAPGSKQETATKGGEIVGQVFCSYFDTVKDSLKLINLLLIDDKKTEIAKVFTSLKKLDFKEESTTITGLAKIKFELDKISVHYVSVSRKIDKVRKLVKDYDCPHDEPYITKYVFDAILDKLKAAYDEQNKRYDKLKKVYDEVKKVQELASEGGNADGLRWCLKLLDLSIEEQKVSVYTVSVKQGGQKLSDSNEIINAEGKDYSRITIRAREFSRFIPEVYVGTAYTFIKYNTYGTTTNASGQQIIAPPTQNNLRNFNVVTMINFSYFIEKSPMHPFIQIGGGVNTGVPAFFTGGGFRFNANGLKRLAVSGGIAFTWLKELDKLQVGGNVSGTDDIEKDLTYVFSTPQPYVAIQYKF